MAPRTLWGSGTGLERRLLDLTAADDRAWDARLLRWDVLGSLGHVEGLRASRLLGVREHARLRQGLRQALAAVERGRLRLRPDQEDVHTAVEQWLTRRLPGLGERLHTGRSRNDQVACDLRLYLKDRLLALHAAALDLTEALLAFASRHRRVLWPGYTHQRRAMPSSVGLWAGAYAEGLLDTDRVVGRRLGPGGSLAARECGGLRRTAAAPAGSQPRGRLASAGSTGTWRRCRPGGASSRRPSSSGARSWGTTLARLAQDVILYSAEEFGYLLLPAGAGDRVQHHAAQAEPRSLRADPRPRRRARGRSRRRAPDQIQALQRLSPRLPAAEGAADAGARPHRGRC